MFKKFISFVRVINVKKNEFYKKILTTFLKVFSLEVKGSLVLNIHIVSAVVFLGVTFWLIEVIAANLFIEGDYSRTFLFSLDSRDILDLIIGIVFCLIAGSIVQHFYISYLDSNRKYLETEERYKLIFEKMINGFFVFEPVYGNNHEVVDMRFIDANPGYEKHTNYKIRDILGKTWSETTQLYDDKFKQMLSIYKNILQTGEPFQYEIHTTKEDEYYLVNAFRIKDEQIGVMLQNISTQKKALFEIQKLNRELEKRVLERTNDLKSVVEELEAYTYTVSHDLKSPLRVIDGYSRSILENHSETIDKEAADMVHGIKSTSSDLIQLINRLLEYSMTVKLDINKELIYSSELFTTIYNQLRASCPERDVKMHIETDLPVITAGRVLIKQVIYNILSNAFKFTKKIDKACITVGCKSVDNEYTFYVKDNGVGFDMEYSGKLFNISERLHGSDEYEGSGIGLATVKKIIQKHGGRTWIEGKINEGAVIYFSIPKELE